MNASILAPDAQAGTHPPSDLLSQVLSLVRLRGETVGEGALGKEARSELEGLPRFYVLTEGRLAIALAETSIELAPGDIALLPHGHAHVLTACPSRPEIAPPPPRFIVGVFHIDSRTLPPVLATLPSVIHVPAPDSVMPPWLAAISHFLIEEAKTPAPGADLMVSRLIDLLVIRALRSWSSMSDHRFGLVAALGDERIARALSALHTHPAHAWTVTELASIAAMSRSNFARHFAAVLGEPPLRYLSRWRIHLAAEMLRSGTVRVSEVAARIGYASEAAFSRAFKASFGHPPKQARGG